MPSFINSKAARNYPENLRTFRKLREQPPGFKLAYNPDTGWFSVQGQGNWTAVKRTLATTDQSVTSEENFAQPVRDVFGEAILDGVPVLELQQALDGLAKLAATYEREPAKRAALRKVLDHVRDLIHSHTPARKEFLDDYRRADPVAIFTPEDRAFLRRIFADREVMSFPITQANARDGQGKLDMPRQLAEKLYDKYKELRPVPPPIRNVRAWVGSLPRTFDPYLQGRDRGNQRVTLAQETESVITNADTMGTAFIYYSTGVESAAQLWRVYVNFRDGGAGPILTTLADVTRRYDVESFKVAGPHAFHTRCDKVVVYVYTKPKAVALAAELHQRHKRYLEDPLPRFTQRLHPGVSVGIEPGRGVVGVGLDEGGKHSYGGLRSELLASALLHYVANQSHLLGPGAGEAAREMAFQKCAAVAFRGYVRALNPDGV